MAKKEKKRTWAVKTWQGSIVRLFAKKKAAHAWLLSQGCIFEAVKDGKLVYLWKTPFESRQVLIEELSCKAKGEKDMTAPHMVTIQEDVFAEIITVAPRYSKAVSALEESGYVRKGRSITEISEPLGNDSACYEEIWASTSPLTNAELRLRLYPIDQGEPDE